jgi:hypothetical protein
LLLIPALSEVGRIATDDITSAALAGNGISNVRRVTVHIPDDYDRGGESYRVVYFIPGFGGSGTRLVARGLGDALDTAGLPPALTVLIDVAEGIVVLNSSAFGRWGDFLIQEVIPFIERTTEPFPRRGVVS